MTKRTKGKKKRKILKPKMHGSVKARKNAGK
jgi:hypothetical protein